ncbi:MAG: Stp1/IreP family PP2C-type Ser/Thr phosphatase [Eubacteriales bacterium]|nr:Stp1/IreP family PP2C-type Ser/Thr phosphatase [Eubacteriales bacterium]MDD4512555.1 Stp1/IreP family PP2C-type Ser/Thr phosphatase [Eubacteriales bacterium]
MSKKKQSVSVQERLDIDRPPEKDMSGIIATYRTHVGKVRSNNEDSVLVSKKDGLYIVADGMGGHNAGEIASAMVVSTLSELLHQETPTKEALCSAANEANTRIFKSSCEHKEQSGMGTTLTILWDKGDSFILGHIGDSRAYLLRDHVFTQMTEDHSVVGELLKAGRITAEQAKTHPYRNVITRAVGTDKEIETDIRIVEKKPCDVWLLCSDGLSGNIDDTEMQSVLETESIEHAAEKLLQMSLAAGGRDNITLVLLMVQEVKA